MNIIYPRLPHEEALRLAAPMIDGDLTSDQVAKHASEHHPRAAPIATGGTPVSADQLRLVRRTVLGELATVGRRSTTGEEDLTLGHVLHRTLKISRADAGNPGVWSFLTLVLLPDVALRRFPRPTLDRLVGAGPRNALRRTWLRHDVFQDILIEGPTRLREDEFVGLMERSSMVRNRALAKSVARELMRRPTRTEDWSREFLKQVRWKTGPLLLDVLSNEALNELVHDVAEGLGSDAPYELYSPESTSPESRPKNVGAPSAPHSIAADIQLTRAVVVQYASAHSVSTDTAEIELREMIRDFAAQSDTWVNRKGDRTFSRGGYTLTTSSDGTRFIRYTPGGFGAWSWHKRQESR